MISTVERPGAVRMCIYASPARANINMFALQEEVPHLVKTQRNNLTAYLNPELMAPTKGWRTRMDSKVIAQVYEAINKNWRINVDDCSAAFLECYQAALSYIKERLSKNYISEKNCRFYACPTLRRNQRDFIIVSGPSGVGKSWWAADYVAAYRWTYPERRIVLMSAKDADEAFDSHEYVMRLPMSQWEEFWGNDGSRKKKAITERFLTPSGKRSHHRRPRKVAKLDAVEQEGGGGGGGGDDGISTSNSYGVLSDDIASSSGAAPPALSASERSGASSMDSSSASTAPVQRFLKSTAAIPAASSAASSASDEDDSGWKPINSFEQTLFIFDDVESVRPEKLSKSLTLFKNYLVTVGRSSSIDIILCNHIARDGSKTRVELNESSALVLFPRAGTLYHMVSYLEVYLRLSKHQIARLLDRRNRCVMLYKEHPMFAISETEIWIV
jgi:hypothetical protein